MAIDELLERPEPPSARDAAAVRLETEHVLRAAVARYREAIDAVPAVAIEHGRTAAAIARLPAAPPEEHEALRALRATWSAPRPRRRGPSN